MNWSGVWWKPVTFGKQMAINLNPEIWVYADLRNERLLGISLSVLSKGRELARSINAKTAVVMMASPQKNNPSDPPINQPHIKAEEAAEKCIAQGADVVYIIENEHFATPRADMYARAFASTVLHRRPILVMLALTDFGRELAARSARINNAGLIADCADLWFEEGRLRVSSPAWGGQIMATLAFCSESDTGFATVQPQAFRAAESHGDPGIIEHITIDRLDLPPNLKLLAQSSEAVDKQGLDNADVVVVGGAGLGNIHDFGLVRDLAAAVGGEVAATRPPVMLHWVDEERLIGQTGKTVRPKLLFSIGTSGAIQYTAGISEAGTIVAINRDEKAPIFQVADLGIVTDAKIFLPLFIGKIKQISMRRLAGVIYTDENGDAAGGFGASVRKLRQAQGLSPEELARATGQSPEFIDMVEKDEVSPPVGFLLRFASALKVHPNTFLHQEEKTLIRNLRAQEFIKRTQNYSYQTLSPGDKSDHLKAFMITIEPQQSHKPVAYKHEGEEFNFVMEGELELTLGNKTVHLRPGESTHFNSDTPHKLKNISQETTRCLVVLYTP